MKLSEEQKKFIDENFQKMPDLIELTRAAFKNGKIDGRSKEGRAVREYLASKEIQYKTTKHDTALPVVLTEEQKQFIQNYTDRILNIHPSLLPKYKGLNTHARALASGDLAAGCSVHLVTSELDAGPVLGQAEVLIGKNETVESLEAKILIQEHILYPKVLFKFSNQIRESLDVKN